MKKVKNKGWILPKDNFPEEFETVWISDGRGWTTLGCIVYEDGNWLWAYSDKGVEEYNGKITSECEIDDLNVVFWHPLPIPPKI